MEEIVMTDDRSDALMLYLGTGISPYPKRDPERLVTKYGEKEGLDLVAYSEGVLQELYAHEPDWSVDDLEGAADRACRIIISDSHPELSCDAVAALKWSYSWDWK
jgi:hypothetical protein